MCDYSLRLIASRPAKVGDKLISTSFPQTSTRGFASVDDRNVAVCLLPGTELAFEKEVQRDTGMAFGWKLGHSVAKFQHVNKDQPNVHHDALEFPDGKTVLLTHLCEGQCVRRGASEYKINLAIGFKDFTNPIAHAGRPAVLAVCCGVIRIGCVQGSRGLGANRRRVIARKLVALYHHYPFRYASFYAGSIRTHLASNASVPYLRDGF